MAPKAKEKKKPVAPASERFDYSRTQGINKDDPRATGPPCHGEHTPAMPGRGSNTGSNAHATWVGCSECGIRLSYTPAFGAHGLTRQAGPLAADTTTQLVEKKPDKGSIELKDKKIGLDAAERSLEKRMETIRKQKEQWLSTQQRKDKFAAETTKVSPGKSSQGQSPERPMTPSPPTAGYAQDHTMALTGSKKSARLPEKSAEEYEIATQPENEEEEEWSRVTPVSPSST